MGHSLTDTRNRVHNQGIIIDNASLGANDGCIIIGKNNSAGGNRYMRMGMNSAFEYAIGDYGSRPGI